MKIIKFINTFAIGIPILLILLILVDNEMQLYAMFSMVLTGVIQTILAIALWIKKRENVLIGFYFLLSISFFLIFFAFNNFKLDDVFSFKFWALPLFLAIYLSILIYKSNDVATENQN